jgi:hypothetical protein
LNSDAKGPEAQPQGHSASRTCAPSGAQCPHKEGSTNGGWRCAESRCSGAEMSSRTLRCTYIHVRGLVRSEDLCRRVGCCCSPALPTAGLCRRSHWHGWTLSIGCTPFCMACLLGHLSVML